PRPPPQALMARLRRHPADSTGRRRRRCLPSTTQLRRALPRLSLGALSADRPPPLSKPTYRRDSQAAEETRDMCARKYHIILLILLTSGCVFPGFFLGKIQGAVHAPQHRPAAGAPVTVRAITSDWSESAQSDAQGEFTFTTVPLGDYKIT